MTAPSTPPRLFPAGRVYSRLARVAGIDLRALATFRVLLGVLLLVNLAGRLNDCRAFYGDDGVLTAREAWEGRYLLEVLKPSLFQPTALLGDRLGGALLFGMGFLGAGMLLVGWRSFWGCLFAWLAILGLDNRNLHVINGGDDLFRLLLFWSLFLPLGARWSLDARRADHPWNRRRSNAFLSVATFALLAQLALMYVVSAMLKSYHSWVSEGTSLDLALNVEAYATPLGHALRDVLPLTLLSRATWWLEFLAPVLIFCPFQTARLRYLLFLAFAGLHLGIEALMSIGLFSFVSVSAWVLVLPGGFWDRVGSWLPGRRTETQTQARPRAARAASWPGWLAGAFLVYILAWNAWLLNGNTRWFPDEARWLGHQLKIHQFWAMFAPTPPATSRWLEARASTRDGGEVALYPDGRPMRARPAHVSEWVTERWRKWAECVYGRGDEGLRERYARFLLREAQRTDPGIVSVRLVLCERPTPPRGEPQRPVTETVLAHCDEAVVADR
jgi:hypothetical protein